MIPFRTNLMFLVVIFFIILFSRKSLLSATLPSPFSFLISPHQKQRTHRKTKKKTNHAILITNTNWHDMGGCGRPSSIALPIPIPLTISMFFSSHAYLHSHFHSFKWTAEPEAASGMEGGLGGELARRFEYISFVLVSPEHMKSTPRTSWFSGCLYLPLSYLIRIIRFVRFGIIECGRV